MAQGYVISPPIKDGVLTFQLVIGSRPQYVRNARLFNIFQAWHFLLPQNLGGNDQFDDYGYQIQFDYMIFFKGVETAN